MSRKQVNVFQCDVGDIIVKDITNEKGVTLVSKGTIINTFIKSKLTELYGGPVWIYNKSDKSSAENKKWTLLDIEKDYEQSILKTKKILSELASGNTSISRLLGGSTRSIYKNVNKSDDIFKYLQMVERHDEYTYTHSVNVGIYAMLIGKWMKLKQKEIMELIHAGLLHDIGKVNIPSEILNKKGKLTSKEYEIMKWHVAFGYDILDEIDSIDEKVKDAVFSHHERMDGSGYPRGISGDYMGIYAKIIAIADVYDAITSDRAYKKKATPFEAIKIFLSEGAGNFDLTVMNTFLTNLACHLIGIKVVLSNGLEGEVVFIPLQDMANPIIRVGSTFVDLAKDKGIQISSVKSQ